MRFTPFCLFGLAHAHSRLGCPPARDMDGFDSTGIKAGPCGDDTNDFDSWGPSIEIKPGPFTINVQESISHRGSGWTFYLSGDGDDDDRCLLLDHIPSNPARTNPDSDDFGVFALWDQLYVTVEIPDVACEKCSIIMSNIMVDKAEVGIAEPWASGCTYDGESGTCTDITDDAGYAYHSCTVPLKITGTIPRGEYVCPGQPEDWPTMWVGDDGVPVDASVPGLYRRESGVWSNGGLTSGNNFLIDVPEKYRTWADETLRFQDEGHCETTPFPILSGNDSASTSDGGSSTAYIAVGSLAGVSMFIVGVSIYKRNQQTAKGSKLDDLLADSFVKDEGNSAVSFEIGEPNSSSKDNVGSYSTMASV